MFRNYFVWVLCFFTVMFGVAIGVNEIGKFYVGGDVRSFVKMGWTLARENHQCGANCSIFRSRWFGRSRPSRAKYLYENSVYAYHVGDVKLSKIMLQEATKLEPKWSYFQLEYANLLAIEGDYTSASKVMSECMAFQESRDYCTSWYEHELGTSQGIQPVGFLKNNIETDLGL